MARVTGGEAVDAVISDPPYGMDYKRLGNGPAQSGMEASARREVVPIAGDSTAFDPMPTIALFASKEVLLWGGDWFYPSLPADGSWIIWDKRASEAADAIPGAPFEVCWSMRRRARAFIRVPWGGWNSKERSEGIRWHPTQKPIAVMAFVIVAATEPQRLIADPFLGSGTTLIAAEQLGRRCVGLELEPCYVDVIVRRWQKLTGLAATLDGDGRTFDEVSAERTGVSPDSLDPTKTGKLKAPPAPTAPTK